MKDILLSELKLAKKQFIDDLEKLVLEKRCSYLDAVMILCNKRNLDIEVAASYISSDKLVRSKLQFEAENLNFLKKGARLPL